MPGEDAGTDAQQRCARFRGRSMPVIRDRDTCAPIAGGCTIAGARCAAARARKRAGRRRSRRRGRCRVRCAEASRRTTGPRSLSKLSLPSRCSRKRQRLQSCSTTKSRSRSRLTRASGSAPTAACPSCSSGSRSQSCRRSPSLRAGRRTAGRRPIRRRRPWPWPARASRGQRSPRRSPRFGGVGSRGEYCTRVVEGVADPAGRRPGPKSCKWLFCRIYCKRRMTGRGRDGSC